MVTSYLLHMTPQPTAGDMENVKLAQVIKVQERLMDPHHRMPDLVGRAPAYPSCKPVLHERRAADMLSAGSVVRGRVSCMRKTREDGPCLSRSLSTGGLCEASALRRTFAWRTLWQHGTPQRKPARAMRILVMADARADEGALREGSDVSLAWVGCAVAKLAGGAGMVSITSVVPM